MIIGRDRLRRFHIYGKYRGDRVFRPLYLSATIPPIRVGRVNDATPVDVVPGAEKQLIDFVDRIENAHEGWELEAREVK